MTSASVAVGADSTERLEALFSNLDRWRHLPAYQLERRVDAFFSIYLREILTEFLGAELAPTIIPELPLACHGTDKALSEKVDYALFSADRDTAFLVELKTDRRSRRDKQDAYLRQAEQDGFHKIVEGICTIAGRTTLYGKYHHLIDTLESLGFIEPATPSGRAGNRGLAYRLRCARPTGRDAAVRIVYLEPKDFPRIADIIERHADSMSRIFAAHLRRWSLETAGVVKLAGGGRSDP
jgi:hypothetical protein